MKQNKLLFKFFFGSIILFLGIKVNAKYFKRNFIMHKYVQHNN